MKLKKQIFLCIAAILLLGCGQQQTNSNQQANSQTNQQAVPGINFQSAQHNTEGSVSIINDKGKRFLQFDENFKTDFGPDLFVILHRQSAPPKSGLNEKDYIKLAKLEDTSGTQRYEIPKNVDLRSYRSVAIWCRAFNVNFGYAPLK